MQNRMKCPLHTFFYANLYECGRYIRFFMPNRMMRSAAYVYVKPYKDACCIVPPHAMDSSVQKTMGFRTPAKSSLVIRSIRS